eukprot:16188086-Heterocapsa_arctica.AAC.1
MRWAAGGLGVFPHGIADLDAGGLEVIQPETFLQGANDRLHLGVLAELLQEDVHQASSFG